MPNDLYLQILCYKSKFGACVERYSTNNINNDETFPPPPVVVVILPNGFTLLQNNKDNCKKQLLRAMFWVLNKKVLKKPSRVGLSVETSPILVAWISSTLVVHTR